MKRLNFCNKWIQFICGCLRWTIISVLVNDSSCDELRMEKGMHQGDPMAPFLILIVVEGIKGLLKQVVEHNIFAGCIVG